MFGKTQLWFIVSLLALALLVAACGGGEVAAPVAEVPTEAPTATEPAPPDTDAPESADTEPDGGEEIARAVDEMPASEDGDTGAAMADTDTKEPEPFEAEEAVADLEPGWHIYSNANYVNDLALHGGQLWAATEGGVAAWDLEAEEATKYTTLDGLPSNVVNVVVSCPVPEPRVVVGTKEGTSVFNPETGTWESWVPEDEESVFSQRVTALACAPESQTLLVGYGSRGLGLWDAAQDTWREITEDEGLGSDSVQAIGLVGDMDEIWTAGSRTLSRIVGDEVQIYTEEDDEILDTYFTQIVADGQGSVWLGQYIGEELIRFRDGAFTVYGPETVETYVSPLGGAQGMDLAPDGTLWIVSSFGNICNFDPATESCLAVHEDEPGMVGFGVRSLVVDDEGGVYFGNENGEGLSAFDGSEWRNLVLESDQLVENELQGLGLDAEGHVWIGTRASGVQWLDPADPDAEWQSSTEPTNLSVSAFYADPAGGLWMGHGSGASFYDGEAWSHLEREDGILSSVESITVDAQGRAWFGSSEGLSIWDDTTMVTMTEESGLPDDYVRALLADGDAVWVGTWGAGLLRFDAGADPTAANFEAWDEESGLPDDGVAALTLAADGSLLIGMDSTVARFSADGEIEEIVGWDQGLDGLVTGIVEDGDGALWLTTLHDGAYRYDGEELQALTPADGLPTTQFYEGALLMDPLGTLWFGGLDGGLGRYVPEDK